MTCITISFKIKSLKCLYFDKRSRCTVWSVERLRHRVHFYSPCFSPLFHPRIGLGTKTTSTICSMFRPLCQLKLKLIFWILNWSQPNLLDEGCRDRAIIRFKTSKSGPPILMLGEAEGSFKQFYQLPRFYIFGVTHLKVKFPPYIKKTYELYELYRHCSDLMGSPASPGPRK